MKRKWWKWFLVATGLVLCVEACMLMVEGPTGTEISLRWRMERWYDRIFGPRVTVWTVKTVVNLPLDEVAGGQDVNVEVPGPVEAVGAKPAAEVKGGADWPMFGGTLSRNMVSPSARNIPAEWSIEDGKQQNIKWVADLGTKSYGGPVVADGKVFFGTNNNNPRDKAVKGQKAILMCFNEADGKFLWQAVHEIPADGTFKDSRTFGLLSAPSVAGKHHYYCTPACEVICADNATGKTVWRYDLMASEKVTPYHCCNCSPLIVDDMVMVMTGNGTDEEGKVAAPKAPSFIAIHKDTGKPVWKSSLPGDKIIEGQWSNPVVAVVDGNKQVIFPGGDCWLYSFDVKTGKPLWKFNCNPLREKDKEYTPYIIATPVVHNSRLYVGLGVAPDSPLESTVRYGYLLCVDVTKSGDVSPKSLNMKDVANKGSALVWAFGGPIDPPPKKGGRRNHFGRTLSTCAVHDGLVYIAEQSGYMGCLDALTGELLWRDDVRAQVWGSPFYADGKVFLGTDDHEVVVYEHGKKLKQLAKIDMDDGIQSTPMVANGVLYIATNLKLYAIAQKK